MVSKDQIRSENLTKDEVMDREFERPQTEIEIPPEWTDEYPGEDAPGDNARVEDDTLVWERDGFTVRLESYETTHWRVNLDIPQEIGQWHPRPVDFKSQPVPEYGFVDEVETDGYAVVGATLIISAAFMPTWEVNNFIDHLIEDAEGAEEYTEEIEEKLALARENE